MWIKYIFNHVNLIKYGLFLRFFLLFMVLVNFSFFENLCYHWMVMWPW